MIHVLSTDCISDEIVIVRDKIITSRLNAILILNWKLMAGHLKSPIPIPNKG